MDPVEDSEERIKDTREDLEEDEGQLPGFVSFVEEAKEVQALVAECCHVAIPSSPVEDAPFVRLATILEKYQEQPHLLNPHLESIVSPLMAVVRNVALSGLGGTTETPQHVHWCLRVVYAAIRVRGYKVIVRFFPHEVADLEPTLALLQAQNSSDFDTWETRYVLLLWLSVLVMIPFDLAIVDSSRSEEEGVIVQLLALGKQYLCSPGRAGEGAVVLLGRLLTRPDLQERYTSKFLAWAAGMLGTSTTDTFVVTGVCAALAFLFKVGQRSELLPHIRVVFDSAVARFVDMSDNTVMRMLSVKLIQRMGLTFLPPRVAVWRYRRGNRSLLQNLRNKANHHVHGSPIEEKVKNEQEEEEEEGEEEGLEVPEEIEDVIGHLLRGLQDKDTIVRWSAAKGVGRITSRLCRAFADEVVSSVLDLFQHGTEDNAWHGGCLALAELARRGLLLPFRLRTVVPLITTTERIEWQALKYDVRKGAYSVGANVRDAACYVCWAFARAYAPEVMQPHVDVLAPSLISTALFDREVNCRRAASAAFQENVGRQGNFPHGIEIVTAADYFTVGNRTLSYLETSVFIAQYPEYCHRLLDDLVTEKVRHWDSAIRGLASKALGRLTPRDPEYIVRTIIPSLIAGSLSPDVAQRHGSVLAVAEITLALSEQEDSVWSNVHEDIVAIAPQMERARMFRGRGGEIVREAVCRLLECVSRAHLRVPCQIVKKMQNMIDENLRHTKDTIQAAAVQAFGTFALHFYSRGREETLGRTIVESYVKRLDDENPAIRRGYAAALGMLPRSLAVFRLNAVLRALIAATRIEADREQRDAETRRNAVTALAHILETVGLEDEGAMEDGARVTARTHVSEVMEALLGALCDYSTDKRGDVGSWVRTAAMESLERLAFLACRADAVRQEATPPLFTVENATQLYGVFFQQAAEKIDRIREHAARCALRMLQSNDPVIGPVAFREQVLQLYATHPVENWALQGEVFPWIVSLLAVTPLRPYVMQGLVISAGDLTEANVRAAGGALVTFLQGVAARGEEGVVLLGRVATSLVQVFEDFAGDDRVIIPALRTASTLISSDVFRGLPMDHTFGVDVCRLLKNEIKMTRDVSKLLAAVDVLCGLIAFGGSVRRPAFVGLLVLLGHRYPRVRKVTAEQLFIIVQTHTELVPTNSEHTVNSMLLETDWMGDIPEVRVQRDALFDALALPRPRLVVHRMNSPSSSPHPLRTTTTTTSSPSTTGYGDLVRQERGY